MRQGDAAQLEIVHQLLEIQAAVGILVGVHPQVPVLADGKISLAPTGDIVQLGGFGGGPAVGRLADRCGLIDLDKGHETSVSFDFA